MGEILKINQIPRNKAKIEDNEFKWMQSFNVANISIDPGSKRLEVWEIRLDKSQFGNWLKERKVFKLFFDGVSKGNPGLAGGGGIIISPEGRKEVEFF